MKNSIFILTLVLCIYGETSGQNTGDKNILDRFYFKAGGEFSTLIRKDSDFKGDANNVNLIGSVIYDYLDDIQLEFVYKYCFDRTYGRNENIYKSGGKVFHQGNSESLTDYCADFKLNYFLNKDKTISPVYLTGILEFDVQNKYDYSYNRQADTSGYIPDYSLSESSSYNRLLVGPGLGAGIFLAFGKIDFQAEANSVFRVAPFTDRGYNELLFNITAALVYKF